MRHLESAAWPGGHVAHEESRRRLLGGSQFTTGSKEEQQCRPQLRGSAGSDVSQGQGKAAPGQMPAAPLFVAQSPAGKGQADEWVKKYLAIHPTESETEALRGAAATLCPPPPTHTPPPQTPASNHFDNILVSLVLNACFVSRMLLGTVHCNMLSIFPNVQNPPELNISCRTASRSHDTYIVLDDVCACILWSAC